MMLAALSPLFFPLVCFACGIYMQVNCGLSLGLLLGAVGLAIGSCCLLSTIFGGRGIWLAVGFLFFFSGSALVQAQRDWQQTVITAYADREIDVVCVIDDITQRATYQDGHIIELSVRRARCCYESDYSDVSFKLMLYTNARPSVKVGDVVEFHQISFSSTEQPRMGNNPSFQHYLLKEGVVGSLFVYGAIDYGVIERPAWSLKGWLWRLREDVYLGVKRKLAPQTFHYFALIFLGNKQQEKSEDLRQTFSYWGLSHYLARAGLHIILFIMVWSWLLNLFPVHLRVKQLMLLVMCIVYALLSWYSIPFARALGSFLLAEGGRFFGYQPTFFHTLTLLCCVILMYSPMQLFFLDFQLTFGLTFVLSWYGRCISSNRQES